LSLANAGQFGSDLALFGLWFGLIKTEKHMDAKELRGALDAVIEACETKPKWNNQDRLVLRQVRTALGTPSQIGPVLGVSVATLHWWERKVRAGQNELQPPPPAEKVRRLKDFVPGQGVVSVGWSAGTSVPAPEASSGFVITRRTGEVLERGRYSRKSWILRCGTPFVVLRDERMFETMVANLREVQRISCFVFRAPKKGANVDDPLFQAKATFDELWRRLSDRRIPGSILARIRGVPVTEDDDANRLGLTDSWTSFYMMQYNEEGRALFGSTVDVWQEFVIVDTEEPEIRKSRLVWLELPAVQAMEWYERRIELLERLEHLAKRGRRN
jgi:hypothetical protein